MMRFWICILLVASVGVYANAQAAEEPDEYQDYYNYDNFDDLLKQLDEDIDKFNDKSDAGNDLKVEEEIKQFREADEQNVDGIEELKSDIDYPFELNEDEEDFNNKEEADLNNNGDAEPEESLNESNNEDAGNRLEPDDKNPVNRNVDYSLLWGDDSVAPLPVPEEPEEVENKAILEETQKILDEKDADNFEDEIKKEIGEVEIKPENPPDMKQIVDETKQLLAENDDSFNEETNNLGESSTKTVVTENSTEKKVDIETVANKDNVAEEDTVDKVYSDLNADLDKLFETLDKLRDGSDSEVEDIDKALEEADNFFEDNNDFDNNNMEGSEELVEDNKDDNPVDLDKLLQDILSEVDADDTAAEDMDLEDLKPIINDEINEPNPDDAFQKDVESLDSKPIIYMDDAIVDNSFKDVEPMENNQENGEANASVEKDVKTALVDDLTSAEMEDLVSQFSVLHKEDLDVHSETFERNTTPVRIILKVDEPTIITSPNYPSPYPTNSVVDYIVEGVGEGIELNITEFAVNGALGDYLLIKPGGVDDSGHDGLLFTYRLNTERRYRFTDVDRLFMRFESKLGMMFFKGFSISAKMIAPISEGPERIPEPEAVVTPPHSTTTLTLAISVPRFREIKEDFRLILADMAEEYINDNELEPGLNTTSEVTNITSVGLCQITWPGYESCSAVTFGISLLYEEEGDIRLNATDLQNMWSTYASMDPYASRLEQLGITEFYPPDSSALTAWLVIAAGVVISMMMLAFVLWRFSCFEDYTRMKAYSDTDSLHNEKRNLDLYPTPHQTLPPLYAENEYKWQEEDSTRVDMGGLANRSYARDNMYDFESDEEVIPSRDRSGAIPTRNFSDV